MEEQKQILYDFQLLSLEIGRPGFSTTTDLLVRSGQIPPYNSSMSNEQIAKYISEYIVNNWNKSDVDRAVRDANSAIPGLRRIIDEKTIKKNIENVLHEYLFLLLSKNMLNDEKFGFPTTTGIYVRSKGPSGVLKVTGLESFREDKEKAIILSRQILSDWTDIDIQNAYNKAINNMSYLRAYRRERTEHSSYTTRDTYKARREREKQRQERKDYREQARQTYYQNTRNETNEETKASSRRFEEDVLNCPSASKYPENCTSRKDYLRQAKIFHPDRNPGCTGTATQKFQVLQNVCKDYKGGKRRKRTNKKRTRKNKSRKFRK
jgi:hypothetical protein